MLITIDVGNTHICLGIYSGRKLIKQFRISTNRRATADEMELVLAGLLQGVNPRHSWQGVVLASVVPELDSVISRAVSSICRVEVVKVEPEMQLPIKNRYEPPSAVGADRLVNAIAAVQECGAPVIVVDFGTAITVDAVSRQKTYLGGAILPGLSLSADALANNTALLHRVELQPPGAALGRNTNDSLRSGVLLGAAGAVSLLIKKIKEEIGRGTKVVATGGMASYVMPFCRDINLHRPQLTLDGLRITWEYLKRRRQNV